MNPASILSVPTIGRSGPFRAPGISVIGVRKICPLCEDSLDLV